MEIKSGGCVPEACRLKLENKDKGSVYYVIKVGHAYYIPDESKLEDLALNQEDNGYSHFPKMLVKEVIQKGTKYF